MNSAVKKNPSLNLLASLALHLGLLFLVGGTVLVQGIVPKSSFMMESPLADEPSTIETPEIEENNPSETATPLEVPSPSEASAPASENNPAFAMDIIHSESTSSSLSLSPPGMAANPGTAPSGLGNGSGASSGGGTGKGPSGIRKIQLFSTEVETNKMGVLMDVSGSAGAYIVPALDEVEKNFKDAPIVFVAGCGIGKNVSNRNVEVKKIRVEKPGERPGFLPLLGRISDRYQSNDVKSHLTRVARQDNIWGVYLNGELKDSTVTTKFGFDELIKENVDSIYWFADFADKVDPEEMQELTKILKEKNIKLIAHNFSGGKIPDAQTQMAQETKGTTIRVKPQASK